MYKESLDKLVNTYVTFTFAMYQYPYLLWYNWYKEMSKNQNK
jgi:hypothetical protein